MTQSRPSTTSEGATASSSPRVELDVERIRSDFPALGQRVHGHRLAYLDSAASALKPQSVIDAVVKNYSEDGANVHRGVHWLSQRATTALEAAREKVAKFMGSATVENVVFTRGTTDGINLVANAYGAANLSAGDEVLISHLEHHSNIVPWQQVCERTGARLVIAPVTDSGELDVDGFERKLSERTKIVSVAHVSNTLGTILPLARIADLAHARGAVMVVDGAQGAPHLGVDVQALGVDFYAMSGHKLYGPNGIGALWGEKSIFEKMAPYQGGGGMIRTVSFEKTTYAGLPERFEAGTPNIAGAIGLGAAVDYLTNIGFAAVAAHEKELVRYGTKALAAIPGLRPIGTAKEKVGVFSFLLENVHPHDLGTILDKRGVAIRAGHHCTQPLMKRFGVPATARASLGIYSTRSDIDQLVGAIREAQEMFS